MIQKTQKRKKKMNKEEMGQMESNSKIGALNETLSIVTSIQMI